MVAATGQTASLHHAAKVYGAVCASHELEVCVVEQDHSTGNPATAASRSRQQAESCSGRPCPLCGPDSLLNADEPVPSVSRATPDVQWNVRRSSTSSGTPSVSHAATRLRSTGASHAGSNASSSICTVPEPVRASHPEGWSSTCLDDRPEQQHPAHHPASCQSPRPQCSYSTATKSGLLPATPPRATWTALVSDDGEAVPVATRATGTSFALSRMVSSVERGSRVRINGTEPYHGSQG